MLFTIWIVFHVLVYMALILVVLLQSSKGEGLAGTSFGGGISGAVFGGRGAATFLSRATTVLAIVFMLNCGVLAFMSAGTRQVAGTSGEAVPVESAVTREAQRERERQMQQTAPADDATTPATTPTEPPAGN